MDEPSENESWAEAWSGDEPSLGVMDEPSENES